MFRTIDFVLNKFPTVPNDLQTAPGSKVAKKELIIDLAKLYHHYYTDSWNSAPPDPDHTNFEYLRFITPTNDLRFIGDGSAANVQTKRYMSSSLGQAFCRYFLYEFCDIRYFAHMEDVIGKDTHPAFNGMKIERISDGDVPDYLCARKVNTPFIGEAKGRFHSISFTNSEFAKWRTQFTRIRIKDVHGVTRKLKGYIIGTRYATELMRRTKSKLFAEDPETPGEQAFNEEMTGLGRGCIALHYAKLFSKLGLRLWSESLRLGFVLPADLIFRLPVWESLVVPNLKGKQFVGGYFSTNYVSLLPLDKNKFSYQSDILRLPNKSPIFFGISVNVVRHLRKVCLGDWKLLDELPEQEDTNFFTSNVAQLSDGSITAPLDYFQQVTIEDF